MLRLTFSEQDIAALRYERYHHPHPRVQMKMEALLLKSQQLPHHQIAACVGISEPTLRSYLRAYESGGIAALREVHFYQPTSELDQYRTTLEAYFTEHPPANATVAAAAIEELTGIKRSPTQIRIFLKKLGLKRLKTYAIPAKYDHERQDTFKKNEREPRLVEAKANQRQVYFVDAAHFVCNCYLGYLWCFTRVFVRAPSGRQRFNVLGALNAITRQLLVITNETYITSTEVCTLLQKIADAHVGQVVRVILDNARYQRCAKVQEYAQALGIELVFLPPYSPNLNLIERVWGFVKDACLYSKYYSSFADFKHSIQMCLSETNGKYAKQLATLITLKFQTFKNVDL